MNKKSEIKNSFSRKWKKQKTKTICSYNVENGFSENGENEVKHKKKNRPNEMQQSNLLKKMSSTKNNNNKLLKLLI